LFFEIRQIVTYFEKIETQKKRLKAELNNFDKKDLSVAYPNLWQTDHSNAMHEETKEQSGKNSERELSNIEIETTRYFVSCQSEHHCR